jgi:hypothetical protein
MRPERPLGAPVKPAWRLFVARTCAPSQVDVAFEHKRSKSSHRKPKPLSPAPRRTTMNRSFNTRNTLSRIAEIATVAVMIGMSAIPAAMAYNAQAIETVAITRLPRVIVTAAGAQEVTLFETVVVNAKRAS